jgi:hypothetical protein
MTELGPNSKESERWDECAYCGSTTQLTRDHVPPRSFFPTPPPPDLITVPSCEKCNAGFQGDEEYARFVLTVDDHAHGNEDRNALLPKVLRFSARRESRNILSGFYSSLGWGYRPNPGGHIALRKQHYTIDVGKLDRFAKRIVKGLFCHEKGFRLPSDYHVNAIHHARRENLDADGQEFVESILQEFRTVPRKSWGTTFAYRWLQSPNGRLMTWWLVEFYGVGRYLCSTFVAPNDKHNPLQIVSAGAYMEF